MENKYFNEVVNNIKILYVLGELHSITFCEEFTNQLTAEQSQTLINTLIDCDLLNNFTIQKKRIKYTDVNGTYEQLYSLNLKRYTESWHTYESVSMTQGLDLLNQYRKEEKENEKAKKEKIQSHNKKTSHSVTYLET